jgi:uncharacterized protein (DUF427 family)
MSTTHIPQPRGARPRLEDIVDKVPNKNIEHMTFEPTAKRVRAILDGVTVADSTNMMIMHEPGRLASYYFPVEDMRRDLLIPSSRRTSSPLKGEAHYWSLQAGGTVAEDAVWSYPNPPDGCPDISKHVALYWNSVDTWLEEDEEVFVHPRDPYHRIDILESSRDVRVVLDGQTLAETTRAMFLFETSLPVRNYIPRSDVRLDLLEQSAMVSACAYKGTTSKYWKLKSAKAPAREVAWCYETPASEVERIAGLISFFNERVDAIFVGGVEMPRPQTPWS